MAGINPAPTVRLRRLGPDDLPQIERHLLTLDRPGRHDRFGSTLGDMAVAAYVRRMEPRRTVVVGAVEGPGGRILGLAEAPATAVPHHVELAVSVHAAYRRRGLGRSLVEAALAAAFARGALVAELHFSPDNQAAGGLIRALGARVTGRGLCWAEIRRPEPAPPRAAPTPTGGALAAEDRHA